MTFQSKTIEQIQWEMFRKKQDFLYQQIIEFAKPPIKGDITRNKLRWRGIKCCMEQGTNTWWVQQRGKQIGNKIKLEINYDGFNIKII